ncbi:MAG: hypothetical protein NTW07_01220 [candidate division Zixibacteria bacterium]|nr:hypothetical protein [candidate division Zixibacteria bacterium]
METVMDERGFYELCLGEYRFEKTEAGALYSRAGVLLTALSLLGALCYALSRLDLVPRLFERVDIFLYYSAIITCLLSLAISAFYLYGCILPRAYPSLASMKEWQAWRDKFRKTLTECGKETTGELDLAVSREMLSLVIPLLAVAQAGCSALNERRRKHFQRAVFVLLFALIALGFQALFLLLIHLIGK